MEKKLLLGVVGNNGSGKSTFCNYLASKQFLVVSLSDVIRTSLKLKNLELNRDNLTTHANQLKKIHGLDYCARQTYDDVTNSKVNLAVFDSIRHPAEVEFLQSKDVTLIAINTPLEHRYNRVKQRKRDTDFVDFETFKQQDEKEANGSSFGQAIQQCLSRCDYEILNDNSVEKFHQKIDLILKQIMR